MGYARPFALEPSAPIVREERACAESGKLLGLELLRFGSALAVLFFHYRHFAHLHGMPTVPRDSVPFYGLLWPLYEYGQYGVQIFWGISGYIFFWKYGPAIHAKSVAARDFFWLRVSRLYPLHIATLGAVIALEAIHRHLTGQNFIYRTDDGGLFVRQLFLATDWGPQAPFSFNGPIWSISAEVAVYAAFFLIVGRFAPTMRLCASVILAGLALQLAGVDWVSVACATYFFAGGLAALFRPKSPWPAAAALASLVGLCAMSGILGDRDKLPMVLLLAVPCLLVLTSRDWPLLNRWQNPVQAAGNLTYSSYLLHFPLQLLLAIVVAASGVVPPLASSWFLAAYLGATLAAAVLSYRWFELPVQRWIRQRTLKLAA
ncbi:acyltransferase [Sphingomonas sp. RB56-2]|uniref:Acyltransferase n=1 Tax=Sphingomonas brevis TaxID=2908206 RepID=A0ABT0S728_9SPHN|nr:acyltransferase [Sphingomonas brevis]MCL6740194.1 acyltransferase [Sphingomonas brevis]